MSIPIWFLDIDGIINSVGMPRASDGVDPADYRWGRDGEVPAPRRQAFDVCELLDVFGQSLIALFGERAKTSSAYVRLLHD